MQFSTTQRRYYGNAGRTAGETIGTRRGEASRWGSAADAEIVVPGRGLRFSGQIVHLTPDGCLMQTACRLERGTPVELWMRTEGMPLRIAARLEQREGQCVELRLEGVTGRKLEQVNRLRMEIEDEARRIAEAEGGGSR